MGFPLTGSVSVWVVVITLGLGHPRPRATSGPRSPGPSSRCSGSPIHPARTRISAAAAGHRVRRRREFDNELCLLRDRDRPSPAAAHVATRDRLASAGAGIARPGSASVAHRPEKSTGCGAAVAVDIQTATAATRVPLIRVMCDFNLSRCLSFAEHLSERADILRPCIMTQHVGSIGDDEWNGPAHIGDPRLRGSEPACRATAHASGRLAGAGGYDDPAIDEALAMFVEAIANRDPRMKHEYFDASGVIGVEKPSDKLNLIASRIREIGVERVLYGSDGALPPRTRRKRHGRHPGRLPLTDAEFKIIANNHAPYMSNR